MTAPGIGGQIGVEIDAAAGMITVVYFGAVTDAQVLAFYTGLVQETPQAIEYDILIDLRHTTYIPSSETIQALGLLVRNNPRKKGRIAAVRRERPEVYTAMQGGRMLDEFGSDRMRFFDGLDAARAWLLAGRG